MPKSQSFKPSMEDWERFKQLKPSLEPEHINEIQELSSKFLFPNESDFIAQDFHANLCTLWSLSKTQNAKIPKAQAKKIENLAISALSSFQKPQIHHSPHTEGGDSFSIRNSFSKLLKRTLPDTEPHSSKLKNHGAIQLTAFKYEGCKRIFIELEGKSKKAQKYATKYSELVSSMAKILREEGITTQKEEEFITAVWGTIQSNLRIGDQTDNFLSESLKTNVWDCDNSSFLVFDIAKEFGIGIVLVMVPNHVFVATTNFFFETTNGKYYPLSDMPARYPTILSKTDDPSTISSIAYYCLGTASHNNGKYKQAIQNYATALKHNPKHANAHLGLGNAHFKLNNYMQAIEAYTSAIWLYPKYDKAYFNRGNAYFKLGNYMQAIKDFESALKINPEYELARRHLALARQQ